MSLKLPSALPHGDITKVTQDIFYVCGTNRVIHDGIVIQTSRTMTIICERNALTLVNTIRLNEEGLRKLEKLGTIKNILRLGAFHGRDDAFYQKVYGAKLWAFASMDLNHGATLDYDLATGCPLLHAKIIEFKTTKFQEALLLLEKADGVLISCDSIKNWHNKDAYFSDETFELMKKTDSIGLAKIDKTWALAMRPSQEEIKALGNLDFSILISAHGLPLIKQAQELLSLSIREALKY